MGSISTPTSPKPDTTPKFSVTSSAATIESSRLAPLRPTTLDTPLEEMRARYQKDGYLFVKSVLPPEDVIQARQQYFEYLSPTGLTKEGSDPTDGIYCDCDPRLWVAPGKLRTAFELEGHNPEYVHRMLAVHSALWFRDFSAHPKIKSFIERLTGWKDSTLLERSILRPNAPGGEATQVHYDQIFLHRGPPTTKLEKQFAEAAKNFKEEERISAFNAAMMETGFLEGDEKGTIRLATDLRYVGKGKPFDDRWMKVYEPDDRL
ncbi:hypothetical protein BDZ45DRAFT_705223 [Acephala macrosclerotiorum]|nr:hypothetical protein BDZ45DRAFT_705223 [Acephala macrosclerotiorum]